MKFNVFLKTWPWKSGCVNSTTWIVLLCSGFVKNKLLSLFWMQGGGVGSVKFHGASHKEYNLLTDVAVMDTGGQLSNKTPALLQFAVMVCIVIEAYCVLYLAENNSLCVGCTVPFSFHRSDVSVRMLVIENHWMFRQVHIFFWRRHTKQNF